MAHPALVAALVLAVVVAGWTRLYLDGRRQRKALGGAQTALGALRLQVLAQGEQIGSLTRALALFVPSPRNMTLARTAAELETAALPEPPIESEGDRGGVNPGDGPTSREVASILARFEAPDPADVKAAMRAATEAEADARHPEDRALAVEPPPQTAVPSTAPTSSRPREARTRPDLPNAAPEDFDDPNEKTHAFTRPKPPPRPPRPSLLRPLSSRPDPLAGVPLESPTSSATRTAQAFAAAHPAVEKTQVSADFLPDGTRERLEALARDGRSIEDVIASGLEAEEERGALVGRLDQGEDKERPEGGASGHHDDQGIEYDKEDGGAA